MYVENLTLKLFVLTLEIKSIADVIAGLIMGLEFIMIHMVE